MSKESNTPSSQDAINAAALILLGQYEYVAAGATLPGPNRECPCCGWPESGHDGPGRYKGNAENTHENGCSLDAILNGRVPPRIHLLDKFKNVETT